MTVELNFSEQTIPQIIQYLKTVEQTDWVVKVCTFLNEYLNQDTFTFLTSGTTGEKKAITATKKQVKQSALATLQYFNLIKGDTVFLSLSPDFIAGKMMIARAIEGQLNVTITAATHEPAAQIEKQYDFAPFVPIQLHNLIVNKKVDAFKQILIGGGQLSAKQKTQLRTFTVNVFESFGMTETLTHFAIKKIAPIQEAYFNTIAGYTLVQNINNKLVLSPNDIIPEGLTTNDLIEYQSATTFNWLGRADNLINSGGIKFKAEEIERKILEQTKANLIVIGLPDEKLGEKIVLVFEGEIPNSFDLNRVKFEKFEKPKTIFSVQQFPRTDSGKVKRKEIVKLLNL